jgi:hypothetical protein
MKALSAALVAGCAWGAQCAAAEWNADLTASAELEHRDNPRLFADGGSTIIGLGSGVDATFARRLEDSELVLAPRLRFVRYDGAADFNTDEQYLDLTYARTRERYGLQLAAGLARDTTLTSELEDTGLIDVRKRHELNSLSASWTLNPDAVDQVGAQIAYQRNTYRDAALVGLVDYDYTAGSLSYSRAFSERTRGGLQLTAGRLDVPIPGLDSRNDAVRLTLESALSDRTSLSLAAGVDRTHARDRDDEGPVYRAEIKRSGELAEWRIGAERSAMPSGSGVLVRRTEFGVTYDRRLSMRAGLAFDLRQIGNQNLRVGTVREDRTYRRASISVRWQATPSWSLFASAAAVLDREDASASAQNGADDTAHGFDATVGFAWAMPRRSISR